LNDHEPTPPRNLTSKLSAPESVPSSPPSRRARLASPLSAPRYDETYVRVTAWLDRLSFTDDWSNDPAGPALLEDER
jgi:hypothetical protein